MQYRYIAAAVILSILLFPGCVQYTEEIWLEHDLSGSISIDIMADEMVVAASKQNGRTDTIFTEEGILKRFRNIDDAHLIMSKVTSEEGVRTSSMLFDFDTPEAIENIGNAGNKTDFMGHISITEYGDTLVYTRTLNMSETEQTEVNRNMLNKINWMYTVHFPGTVIGANVPESNIHHDINAVTWAFSLAALTEGTETMKAIFVREQPPRSKGLLFWGLTIAGVGAAIIIWIKYRKFFHKAKLLQHE